ISDWSMPEFSAPQALEVFQARQVDIPFIIISGTIGEEIAVAALKAGAHDFLVKGRLARLGSSIERALRDAEVRREKKKMQEQLLISDRMASVGVLAAGVAHEINNPLVAVMSNLELAVEQLGEMLARSPDLSDVLDEVRDAFEAARRIRAIAADLKLFSRGRDDQRGPVDAERVIESAARMAWNEIRHRAQLVKELGNVPHVEANESKLGQVVLNLVVNASQAIPEGHADENTITLRTYVAADGRVAIEVRDSGSGIAPDVMPKLFTPFMTTKPIGVGTGLGLSICHRIVSSFGGEIVVESEVGRGSVFRVLLLRANRDAPASEPPAPARGATARRARVLVVDDEEAIGVAVQRLLSADHDVTITTKPAHALELVQQGQRFDVVLCDVMMPDMTGMDLFEAMPADIAERMVFLTGGAFTPRARQFLAEIKNQRVDKPFDRAVLDAVVRRALDQFGDDE
ncbi:MAG TPA: ATP-binding protein, partial [Myxococcota bacterium]